ncbi:hypothetical protein Bhyg_10649 [Pseudolycoriella hygida]|uniref:Uncharacterized protein n=1 Tax=Pseudolycoriella hygida TaxID=35572 RepID=A0A9Q0RZF7_9DIPT|nr:hypothetical protein Bhyg_10649 [Pseudolycoriella hygida]
MGGCCCSLEQPSVYAVHSDNNNSETKTSQSVIEEQLPSDLDRSPSVTSVQESSSNPIPSTH